MSTKFQQMENSTEGGGHSSRVKNEWW